MPPPPTTPTTLLSRGGFDGYWGKSSLPPLPLLYPTIFHPHCTPTPAVKTSQLYSFSRQSCCSQCRGQWQWAGLAAYREWGLVRVHVSAGVSTIPNGPRDWGPLMEHSHGDMFVLYPSPSRSPKTFPRPGDQCGCPQVQLWFISQRCITDQ